MIAKDNAFFRIEDIKNLANDKSFERGKEYFYSDTVKHVEKRGNVFTGTVQGSMNYKVSLDITNNELNFKCNCPYDFGDICKHEVAFALEILDGGYTETAVQQESGFSKEDFEIIFESADKQKKLKFLKQLLDRDNNLQSQFIAFNDDIEDDLDNIVGENIDEVRDEIHDELSTLDFNDLDIYSDYDDAGYYHDEYENMYDQAEEMIENVFSFYVSRAKNYIRKGNLLDGIRVTLGIYEGAQNLPELDNDNYSVFDGEYNANVRDIRKKSLSEIAQTIESVVKPDKTVLQIIDLIINRLKEYQDAFNDQTGSGEENIKDKDDYEEDEENEEEFIIYNICDFEKIFLSLVVNKTTAVHLHQQLQKNALENYGASFIILYIAEILDDETLWIKTAENNSNIDKKIARLLLEKYEAKKMVNDFNRIAKTSFEKWANDFDFYLIENLDKERQKDLYIRALKNYVKQKKNVEYYKILRPYLPDDEKLSFVDGFKDNYDTVFYVQMLEIEKRFEEILECAKKNMNSYDFDKILLPILNIYPSECFKFIVVRNNSTMKSYKRNRDTYQSMIKTLRLLKQIESKKAESDLFLKELYNHKPNLPALKDELRKANLVIG